MELSTINIPGTNMAGDVSGSRGVITDLKTLSSVQQMFIKSTLVSRKEMKKTRFLPSSGSQCPEGANTQIDHLSKL